MMMLLQNSFYPIELGSGFRISHKKVTTLLARMQNFRLKKVSMPYNVHNGAISRDFFFQALQKSMKSKLHEDYIRMCRITTYVLVPSLTPIFSKGNSTVSSI